LEGEGVGVVPAVQVQVTEVLKLYSINTQSLYIIHRIISINKYYKPINDSQVQRKERSALSHYVGSPECSVQVLPLKYTYIYRQTLTN